MHSTNGYNKVVNKFKQIPMFYHLHPAPTAWTTYSVFVKQFKIPWSNLKKFNMDQTW